MFSKILIANRGEIACRVIKTARKMGIKTVAVYSEADQDALHVDMADEAVLIGPPPAAQSYLVVENILKAVKETGAEAVHPGYGFLSENAEFAKRLEAEGIVFIGPNIEAIRIMGDKIESKKFASEAGVNTVPGYLGVIQDADEAIKIADDIGYPVMIKASAGGGGKGMRIAWNRDEVAQGFESSMSEARSSFGDDRVFIEKFITNPRHIEIQVLGDKHGNIIHVGERECSIQRRNQKVIEESPSPFVDEKMRSAMGKQAVALARAVQYESAGTVEFIVDSDHNFYFLEMNTRLQVEHPVTELVTGIDLVEQMIRVAAGEELSLGQKDIRLKGWAIESRIYAEDPYRSFLPSIGRLVYYRPPEEGRHGDITLRNDTGVYEGGEISLYYDPMIAKLCVHAPTREAAIAAMVDALDDFRIDGIEHNIPFLAAVMTQERFRSGKLTTTYIADEFPDGFQGASLDAAARDRLIAVAALLHGRERARLQNRDGQVYRHLPRVEGDWIVHLDDQKFPISLRLTETGAEIVIKEAAADSAKALRSLTIESDWAPGDLAVHAKVNGAPLTVQVKPALEGWYLGHHGAKVQVVVRTERASELAALMPEKAVADTSKYLLCPMPGQVIAVHVEPGQEVKAGETLAVVEAMKMENVLVAERDSVVLKIVAKPGDNLAVDDVIIEFE